MTAADAASDAAADAASDATADAAANATADAAADAAADGAAATVLQQAAAPAASKRKAAAEQEMHAAAERDAAARDVKGRKHTLSDYCIHVVRYREPERIETAANRPQSDRSEFRGLKVMSVSVADMEGYGRHRHRHRRIRSSLHRMAADGGVSGVVVVVRAAAFCSMLYTSACRCVRESDTKQGRIHAQSASVCL